MRKLLVIVSEAADDYNKFLTSVSLKTMGEWIPCSPTKQGVANALKRSDADMNVDEPIFICTNESVSKKLLQVFQENKYQEKVIYRGDVTDTRELRGPTMTWNEPQDLPQVVKNIGRIFAFHENF